MNMASVSHPDPGFSARLRRREPLVGYQVRLDSPVAVERIAGLGYDYVEVDGRHGVVHQPGWQVAMLAVDARGRSAGVIQVPSPDPVAIGAALDAGARGVIVPMVENAEQARNAVRACRHRPAGTRSPGGPVRAELRMGSVPSEVDDRVACIVMIETAAALEDLDAVCATEGLDAVYAGPAGLSAALGARRPGDPAAAGALEAALEEIARAARRHDIACGIHVPDGDSAAKRLAEGFTFATVSSDITHLEQAAATHLRAARALV
ncbi:4-hydroxy-2-oxo-heptane-1,7-dioate aldolase (plasmid) [Streptomyces sp. enrichment culture]